MCPLTCLVHKVKYRSYNSSSFRDLTLRFGIIRSQLPTQKPRQNDKMTPHSGSGRRTVATAAPPKSHEWSRIVSLKEILAAEGSTHVRTHPRMRCRTRSRPADGSAVHDASIRDTWGLRADATGAGTPLTTSTTWRFHPRRRGPLRCQHSPSL